MHHTDFIALDTETGGTRPGAHALLTIAAVRSWDSEHDTFLRHISPESQPGKHVEPDAARINGYTPALWSERGASTLRHAMLDLEAFLAESFRQRRGALMLAHNAGFDRMFLDESAHCTGIRLPIRHAWRCSMDKLGTLMDRGLIEPGTAKLDRLGELSGQWPAGQRPAVHDALHDALACLRGYQWLLKKERAPEATVKHLYDLSLQDRRRLENFIIECDEWMNSDTRPPESWARADEIARRMGELAAEIQKEGRADG